MDVDDEEGEEDEEEKEGAAEEDSDDEEDGVAMEEDDDDEVPEGEGPTKQDGAGQQAGGPKKAPLGPLSLVGTTPRAKSIEELKERLKVRHCFQRGLVILSRAWCCLLWARPPSTPVSDMYLLRAPQLKIQEARSRRGFKAGEQTKRPPRNQKPQQSKKRGLAPPPNKGAPPAGKQAEPKKPPKAPEEPLDLQVR